MSAARDRAEHAYRSAFGRTPEVIARAPGRVNLIGEHVDYNDGLVLPFAIERDVVVCAGPAGASGSRVCAADQGTPDAYVHAVAAELAALGIPGPGFELTVAGDVPAGAGLSSSAALTSATALALLSLFGATLPALEIARVCRRAEQRAVGVECGIMDPFTCLFAREGHALLLDCRTLEHDHVRIPEQAALVIVNSGASRTLAGSAYNQRVEECRAAARRLRVGRLRDATLAQVEAAAQALGDVLYRRARHVVTEIERTRQAARALQGGDLERVGRLMNESHHSLRRDYEVSSPQLDGLVDAARQVPGVWGSRLTGAGFGGCTITLLNPASVSVFERQISDVYPRAASGEWQILRTRSGGGAALLQGSTDQTD